MSDHSFKLGDRVHIVRTASASTTEAYLQTLYQTEAGTREGGWEVVRLLPPDSGGLQYHVRATDGLTRAVHESQLERA